MYGEGNVGLEKLTPEQYKTHFSIWALLGSPLMIGCDIRKIDGETLKILSNRELIAINQDESCRQVYKLTPHRGDNLKVYARNLENGDIAIGIFNFRDEWVHPRLILDELGLPESTGRTLEMHELWSGETQTVKNGTSLHKVAPYGCLVYRCRVVKR